MAVVGASATPGKVGNAVLDSLLNYDYAGKVYPINPARAEIMGAKCYPTLAAVPDQLDVVVVAVALAAVPELIAECAALGIHNLVVVSGGGKELGGDKVALERQIRRLARVHEVRIVGPNCIGVFDGHTRLDTFFQVQERMQRPVGGRLAMITQSGTVGIALPGAGAPSWASASSSATATAPTWTRPICWPTWPTIRRPT